MDTPQFGGVIDDSNRLAAGKLNRLITIPVWPPAPPAQGRPQRAFGTRLHSNQGPYYAVHVHRRLLKTHGLVGNTASGNRRGNHAAGRFLPGQRRSGPMAQAIRRAHRPGELPQQENLQTGHRQPRHPPIGRHHTGGLPSGPPETVSGKKRRHRFPQPCRPGRSLIPGTSRQWLVPAHCRNNPFHFADRVQVRISKRVNR